MYFVYLMRSIKAAKEMYIGVTTDMEQQLLTHNSGCAKDTTKHRPWKMIMHFAFAEESKAHDFKSFLETPAGKAFSVRRLW